MPNNIPPKDFFNMLNGNPTPEELAAFAIMMQGKGMQGSFMAVSSEEESQAASEYIEYHNQIPQDWYLNMPEKEIEWSKNILFNKKAKLEDKKRALFILAHVGRIDVYKILEKYEKKPDPKLKIWFNMAIQECKDFMKNEIMDKPTISFNRVSATGRNEPCPCGSGKRFGECCGGE